MAFQDARLPEDIEVGAVGGPSFLTNVVSISSGAEQRNAAWAQQRAVWQIGYGLQNQSDYIGILNHFYGQRGRTHSFPFKDWSDYQATLEPIATGDGHQREFHLIKTYGGTFPFVRYITRPDWTTVQIFVNGSLNTTWTQGANGAIVWAAGLAPAIGATITWSGNFFIPVRYDVDQFTLTLYALATGTITALNILEVREDPNNPPIALDIQNDQSPIGDNADTSTQHLYIADVFIIDDNLGQNGISITGPDAAFFEIDTTTAPVSPTLGMTGSIGVTMTAIIGTPGPTPPSPQHKLYLKQGTVLDHTIKATYTITLNTWDLNIGPNPSATQTYTLTVNEVNRPPKISLVNTVTAFGLSPKIPATSMGLGLTMGALLGVGNFGNLQNRPGIGVSMTAALEIPSDFRVADINVVTHSTGTYALSLSGANAANFEIVGSKLYLKGTQDFSASLVLLVTVTATDAAVTAYSPPSTSASLAVVIGVSAGTQLFDTPGTFTFPVPQYSTFKIDVDAAGCGTWGFSPGNTVAPTPAGQTYVQNDQSLGALNIWRIQPFTMAENPTAYTPGQTVATAKMGSYGIGPTLAISNGGQFGGSGASPMDVSSGNVSPLVGRGIPSGKGGDATLADGTVVPGGAALTLGITDLSNTSWLGLGNLGTPDVHFTVGNNGGQPGAGGGGGIYKAARWSGQAQNAPDAVTTTDMELAGGGSGMLASYTFTYNSPQSGSSADYFAPAPSVGQTLTIVIGAGGIGGAGTVTGTNGGHGRVRLTWS